MQRHTNPVHLMNQQRILTAYRLASFTGNNCVHNEHDDLGQCGQ